MTAVSDMACSWTGFVTNYDRRYDPAVVRAETLRLYILALAENDQKHMRATRRAAALRVEEADKRAAATHWRKGDRVYLTPKTNGSGRYKCGTVVATNPLHVMIARRVGSRYEYDEVILEPRMFRRRG